MESVCFREVSEIVRGDYWVLSKRETNSSVTKNRKSQFSDCQKFTRKTQRGGKIRNVYQTVPPCVEIEMGEATYKWESISHTYVSEREWVLAPRRPLGDGKDQRPQRRSPPPLLVGLNSGQYQAYVLCLIPVSALRQHG